MISGARCGHGAKYGKFGLLRRNLDCDVMRCGFGGI